MVLISSVVPAVAFAHAESASEQFQNGTPINEIQCDNPRHILVERNNGNPACVTERTAEKLGWEQIIPVESVAQNSIKYGATLISFLEEDFVFTHKQVSRDHVISELGPGNGLYWPQYTITFPRSAQVGVPFDVIYDYAFAIPDEETGSYVDFNEQCSEYRCGKMIFYTKVSHNVDVVSDGWEQVNETFDSRMIPMRNFTHYYLYPEFDNTQPLQETFTYVINDPGDAYRIGEINLTMTFNRDDLLYFYVDDSGNVIFDPLMTKKTFEQSAFASSDDPSMASVASAIERELDKLQERPYDQRDIEVIEAPTGLRDGPPPEVYDHFAERLLREYPDDQNFEDLLRSWNLTQSWINDFLSVKSELRPQIADFLASYTLLPMAYGQEAVTTVSGQLVNTDEGGSSVFVYGGTVCAYDVDGSDINPIIVNNEHVCSVTTQSGTFFFDVPTADPDGPSNTDLVLKAFAKNDHFEFVKNNDLDVVIDDNTRLFFNWEYNLLN